MAAWLDWLRAQRPAMETLLAELVDVNSFSDNPAGCTAVARRLDVALRALAPELGGGPRVGASGRAEHLSYATAAPGAPTLLIGHHDTVFPPGTFEGYRSEGDFAYGPGVLDMKGGLVVMAFALGALSRAGRLGALPLRLVSVADEEVGSPDGRAVLLEAAAGARAALVFESGRRGDLIITQRKGTGGVVARAEGRAAHAGNGHADGANAIWALARFIDLAQRLTDYPRGVTINVGKVSGGTSKNTVPAAAECGVDLRFLTPDAADAVMASLHIAAAQAAAEVPGTRISLSGGVSRLPLVRTEASAALKDAYAVHARAVGLGDGEAPLLGGGSDANTVATLGVPAIDGLGPRGLGFHTHDEYIELPTLLSKAEALARYLDALA